MKKNIHKSYIQYKVGYKRGLFGGGSGGGVGGFTKSPSLAHLKNTGPKQKGKKESC